MSRVRIIGLATTAGTITAVGFYFLTSLMRQSPSIFMAVFLFVTMAVVFFIWLTSLYGEPGKKVTDNATVESVTQRAGNENAREDGDK